MRNPNRIPILLDYYSRPLVKSTYLRNVVGLVSKTDIHKYTIKWKALEPEIAKIWLANPDSRMSQVLIHLGILPNFSGSWFYTEDEVFLINAGIATKRDTTIWNKVDGDLIERGIPLSMVSDLDLYQAQEEMGDDLPNYLLKEIEYREDNDVKVVEEGNLYYVLDID